MSASTPSTPSPVNENSSREKTQQWLEDILQKYLTHLAKKKAAKSGENEDKVKQMPPVEVTVVDFDIGPGFHFQGQGEDRLSTLSDLLSLSVTYKIDAEEDAEKRTEHLMVKIPPNDRADREMAQMAQVDKREIHFYTEALTELEEWAKNHQSKKLDLDLDPDLKISVPKCIFAKYHLDPSLDEGSTNISEAESVLVLQDLRPLGYTMRDFSLGLTLEETKAALREIAKVHAISWSMQEQTGEPLEDKWHFAYRSRKAASAYKMMIEQGFPILSEFLARKEQESQGGPELLKKLNELHPKAAELLCELLEPPSPPIPSCLTHMDFWSNNLLFRRRTQPDGEENETLNSNSNSNPVFQYDMECMILDWQMIGIGRPTHDIALILFTSLAPEVRRKHTDELLIYYWTVFEEIVVNKLGMKLTFDFKIIQEEFKKSQLLALLLVIGSIDLALDKASTETRLMQALLDMSESELI